VQKIKETIEALIFRDSLIFCGQFCTLPQLVQAGPMSQQTSAFRFATLPEQGAHNREAVQWLLKRHCSLTPVQLGGFYLSLCAVSLSIAVFFWLQGATLVMLFAGAELLAVGLAFLVYARHAADVETIILQDGQLVVQLESAGRTQRAEFNREWVRVEPKGGDGSLIEVSGQGQSVQVGRHVRPELRPALAREIRFALRAD
jgi:uncharacterized membrane protein